MKIEKKHLEEIKRCYCASNIPMYGENHITFASEDPNVGCFMFSGNSFDVKEELWKEPGGCMSIIPIPNREGEILAVQEFYLKVTPSLAKIVWGKYNKESGWQFKDVLQLPYLHRFDICNKNGVNYFICSTIAQSKENKEDWSKPGCIYTGILPDDLNEGIKIELLCDDLYRNHGYWHGKDACYFGSDQGILKVKLPININGKWEMKKILDGKIGEIASIDIDQDGEEEIMTIEPFHGNAIKIYKKINEEYKEVYQYANKIDFAHTLVGATLCGVPTFVAGIRREDAELFYVQFINGEFVTKVIDTNVGPANICVVNEDNRDLIVAANHTAAEAAVYIVTEN